MSVVFLDVLFNNLHVLCFCTCSTLPVGKKWIHLGVVILDLSREALNRRHRNVTEYIPLDTDVRAVDCY